MTTSETPPQLAAPDGRFRESYLVALREYQAEGNYLGYTYTDLASDFDRFVLWMRMQADPRYIAPGRAPATYLWLVNDDNYIGHVSIRHVLTNDYLIHLGGHIGYAIRPSQRQKGYGTQALRLALPYARQLGLDRVLLTCNDNNIGSRRIIEANGGVFEGTREGTEEGKQVRKLRYWFDLAENKS